MTILVAVPYSDWKLQIEIDKCISYIYDPNTASFMVNYVLYNISDSCEILFDSAKWKATILLVLVSKCFTVELILK